MEFVALWVYFLTSLPCLFVICRLFFGVFAFLFRLPYSFFGNFCLCRNAVYFVVGLIDGIWRHAGKISAFVIYK